MHWKFRPLFNRPEQRPELPRLKRCIGNPEAKSLESWLLYSVVILYKKYLTLKSQSFTEEYSFAYAYNDN